MDVVNLRSSNNNFLTRSETLMRFYHDVAKYKILSLEEENEWINIYVNGSSEQKEIAKNELITSNIRFVIAMAKKYGNDDNVLDLINEGIIALNESLERFNPKVGVRFLSFAVWYVKREITNYCMNKSGIVRKKNAHKTYHIMSKVTNKFIQKELRQPTLEELQEILINEYNVDIKDVNDILETKVSSIDERFDDEDETCIGDILLFNNNTLSNNSYEDITNKDFNNKLLTSLFKNLNEREITIIKLLYGIGYERPYEIKEVANIIGMTSERIRQLKKSIVEKMKCHAERLITSL